MKRVFFGLFLMLSLMACSASPDSKGADTPKDPSGPSPKVGPRSYSKKRARGKRPTKAVTLLCRCGKGRLSWSGGDEPSVREQVKKLCESVSQSLSECELK